MKIKKLGLKILIFKLTLTFLKIISMFKKHKGQSGLQVLMFISIIFFLTTMAVVFVLNVQKRARDSERMTALANLQKALDLYHDAHGTWPEGDDDGSGWDEGMHSSQDRSFIRPLVEKNFILVTPSDPKFYGAKAYKYHLYEAGYAGCSRAKGRFYVLGIPDLESDTRPPKKFTGSGFRCKNRDWGEEFDYVIGKFEGE